MAHPRTAARLTVRPLTRESADYMGHILWLEEADALSAFKKMFDAIKDGPYNCAVWADAGAQMDPEQLLQIKKWRQMTAFKGPLVRPDESVQDNPRAALSGYFAGFARNTAQTALAPVFKFIENHVRQQVEQINAAAGPARILYTLRADKMTQANPFLHVDGARTGKNAFDLRFLQSLASPSTCVCANKSARPFFNRDDFRAENAYELDDTRPATLWQAPENSLVLLTNQSHAAQPILHSAAVTAGPLPVPRTISVFDVKMTP